MMLKETSLSAREVDPLLKDLTEKKRNFRHSIVSLAAELKDVRGRLASQEESFARETIIRQAAEANARSMEDVICQLQRRLEEKNGQLQVSKSDTEQYLKELDILRSQLSVAQATADESAASAQSVQLQCLAMLRELDEKSSSLKEHESRVTMLGEQLDHLHKDLEAREASQKQLKDEVLKIEEEIMLAVAKAGALKDQELRKILEEDILKDFGSIKKHLNAKDEEISRLRDEVRVMSAHWKLKTKELESQLEKHRRSDQELKKRVLKLEFCLQEARSQVRKLQRAGEKRDKALMELRDQLAMKQQMGGSSINRQNFWESSGFKIGVSVSILVLVLLAKQITTNCIGLQQATSLLQIYTSADSQIHQQLKLHVHQVFFHD